jgi:hypothetical protein
MKEATAHWEDHMELTLTEAAGYLSRALGKTVTTRQLRPQHALVMNYSPRQPFHTDPDTPRLAFDSACPIAGGWGLGGRLEVYCDSEAERGVLSAALNAARGPLGFYGDHDPAGDAAILRGVLTTKLGWTLCEDEEAALRRAAIARGCRWPYDGLEIRQERPGGRVTVSSESVRAVAAAVPAMLERSRASQIESVRKFIEELRGYDDLDRSERRMLRKLEEAFGAETGLQLCAA